MTTVTFDTLRYAEALKTGGVPEAQAKAQAVALAEALHQGGQDLATKGDIAELRMATKADTAELKAEIQAMINRLLLSLIGIIVGSMVAMTGIFAAIVKWL
ncbi:MAG: DUF1640 domain-containing protein [Gammaproteobacteria bacterium]